MDRSRVIFLIKEHYSQNEVGEWTPTERAKKVYANIQSASASEWFEGGRSGLNPAYKITMFAYDYDGETVLKVGATRYQVYRTYRPRTDLVELHVQREAGA